MLVKISSVAHVGLESIPVVVEVDVANAGFPGLTIVGLAGKAVEEARERVKTAIINSGYSFPTKRITVNLAPADLPKEGGAYDLPIGVGILAASGQIPEEKVGEGVFFGEVSLDGSLQSTRGVLLCGIFAEKMRKKLYVPIVNSAEAAVVTGLDVYGIPTLEALVKHLTSEKELMPIETVEVRRLVGMGRADFDMADVVGQETAKRALEIAAAGGHNLLFCGPPGTGKTMLSRAMPGILPPLSEKEILDVTRIYSVAGELPVGEAIVRRRPFRSPHHGISVAGMIGGGSSPIPGEVSLSHLGVLFLDEMAEFPRAVLEALRQPMEDGVVNISRAAVRVAYPARFALLAAVNPCPCGYLGHPTRPCICGERQIQRYRQRMSGPVLDRIDMMVKVPVVDVKKLGQIEDRIIESSQVVQKRVVRARLVQEERFANEVNCVCNAAMRNKQVKVYCSLDEDSQKLLLSACEKLGLSTRGYFKVLKVARTIADLAGNERIVVKHIAEALQYRM